jgi:hypothetical protein
MRNRPSWYTNEHDAGFDRVKAAFANDWEQTKHDFGSKTARDLNQNVNDTVKQASGSEDPFSRHETAFRFGYAAQRNYKTQYPTWSADLDSRLRKDYGDEYDRDRDYIRYAYDYQYDRGSENRAAQRDESRP